LKAKIVARSNHIFVQFMSDVCNVSLVKSS